MGRVDPRGSNRVDTKNTSIRGGMEQLPSYETSKCNMDFEQFPIGDANQLFF